ncbi:hypothetical protein Pst134EA_011343 [Puccinia striiformis f. sp. tritici]|uniref:hypothetical protein n=1 Tax=Puccinia striiformis f. sp. tritici TaxID=168172 RepID=UPI0020075752|nr:hypothetical protein Pst134EA_011343 [Puccinia striiformis f. sp. tritici]KAH9467711.1 hypothetical protein Pst134EA_011343 [Puccinia striiformis f. sp. tritici]
MVGQTTLDSYFRSPRTSEVASNRSAPNSNNLPANSIGAAAAVLPNVADLFANAFKPLGNTAPTVDQANTNQTSVDQPRVNHDNVDPLLASHTTNDIDPALLPLPSSCTSSHHATSTRSETGASTAAIQEQLTTENVRNLNGRAETQTITGEHSDQESIAIITDLPIPNSLAQATLNAAAARRNFPPTTEFLFRTHLEFKNQYLMAIATDNLAAAAMFREQAIRSHRSLEGLMTTDVLTLLTEGWNPITARLPRTAGEPTIRQNRTQPYQRRARGPHPVQESNSPTLDTHRQQAPTPEVRPPHPPRGGPQRGGNGRMRNRPEYRASVFDEIF